MALIDETPIDPTGDSWIADHVKLYVESGGKEGHHWQPGVPTLLLTTAATSPVLPAAPR